MRTTLALAVALWAGTAAAQYPYAVPPAWGYMNKAEAIRQQNWENQMRAMEFQQSQWDRAFGSLDITDRATKSVRLRLLKEQERSLRLENDRKEKLFSNPFK